MRLGWDEIKRRAKAFSDEWKDAHYEKGETQSFYNDFFEIFGIRRRQVAVYEKQVQAIDATRRGFIDLFWPGTLIVEQKSAGKDLYKAQLQASEYFNWLPQRDQPRFILTCDFQRWKLVDLDDNGRELSFTLPELHKHVTAFDFMLGRKVSFETQASVTIKAAELMGKLHDALEASGYVGHDLEQLLVRLLFCLFADDTGIFQPKDIFLQLVENDTRPDGSDVGRVLNDLFDVLDTPEDKRQSTLQAELNALGPSAGLTGPRLAICGVAWSHGPAVSRVQLQARRWRRSGDWRHLLRSKTRPAWPSTRPPNRFTNWSGKRRTRLRGKL